MNDVERTDAFRGLAHPLRREVLKRLAKSGESAVVDLIKHTKATPQAMSRHLSILRETGLVTCQSAGASRRYKLKATALKQIQRWVNQVSG